MNIKFFGVKIYISYLFVAIITLMLFFDRTGLIIPLGIAVFFHETAHFVAMKKLKCAPSEILLIPGSVRIQSKSNYNLKNDNIVLLCGPLSNILLFAFLYIFGFYRNAAVQLVVGVYNLLPAKGLDGGSILYNFLIKKTKLSYAKIIYTVVSLCVGLAFIVLNLFFVFAKNMNLSFLIFGIYIIVYTLVKM